MLPDLDALLDPVQQIAIRAGQVALEYYGGDHPVELKADNSPLTLADRAAHDLITEALANLTPDVPIVSEESAHGAAISRDSGEFLWLVDPLDGTKEFIKQSGQFTVNIGLIQNGAPKLGIVYVPVTGVSYGGARGPRGDSAWIQNPAGPRQPIHTRAADLEHLTVVASRDHAGPVVTAFLDHLSNAEVTSMGSSLKVCLVAEGKADFYPRVVPTMQWDTAAAHAVVEAAGGHLTDLDGHTLQYRKDQLRNPSILVFGDDRVPWARFFADGDGCMGDSFCV